MKSPSLTVGLKVMVEVNIKYPPSLNLGEEKN